MMTGTVRVALASVVALAAATTADAAELVTNGGFETGDFSGWVLQNPDANDYNGVDTTLPRSGVYGAYFGNVQNPATLSQTLATMAGENYLFSFYVLNEPFDPFPARNGFVAKFGDTTLLSLADVASFTWQKYSYTVTATSGATTISFSAFNGVSYMDLDDVSVTGTAAAPVPEPATWAMMIAGFGLLGGAMRRRSVVATFA